MKIIYSILFFSISGAFSAQIMNKKTESFTVKGNCEHCKERIENTVNKSTISSGVWDIETHNLTLEYDSVRINSDVLLKEIANVGHDNDKYKAEKNIYDALPACCMYERNDEIIHKKDSLHIHNESFEGNDLKEVKVKGKEDVIQLTDLSSLTYNISKKELLKAACCNLSESFETSATVDVSYTNAITGTKQLKMLGLDQKYTLITKEYIPDIRGLGTALGLNFIPGRWIESIQLTKGTGTVVNGYESFTGQINAEMLKYKEPKDETTFNFSQIIIVELNLMQHKPKNLMKTIPTV